MSWNKAYEIANMYIHGYKENKAFICGEKNENKALDLVFSP